MNRKNTIALLAVCGLTVGMTLVAQEAGNTSSKVEQLEKEMHDAQRNNDATWYQRHVADGYVEGYSWGDWATKEEAIKQAQDKSIKFNKAQVSEMKVATFGPNVGIAHYKFTYDGTLNGTHRARTVICSDTWVSESGEWKLASNHCSHVQGK